MSVITVHMIVPYHVNYSFQYYNIIDKCEYVGYARDCRFSQFIRETEEGGGSGVKKGAGWL